MKEGVIMKYISTLFWGFILGHVAYYLGSQLTTAPYEFMQASILGLVISLAVFVLAPMINKTPENKTE